MFKYHVNYFCSFNSLFLNVNKGFELYILFGSLSSYAYWDFTAAENTRAAYPIEYIPNAKIPCVGPHPKNIILLACDAFGVLPPVSKLSLEQTMYHFISGYTALVI